MNLRPATRLLLATLIATATTVLPACVAPATKAGDAGAGVSPTGSCSTVGQPCEFTPGKLGACVRRDDCAGDNCFVCQSQH